MKECIKCHKIYKASSRHRLCPSCRKQKYKNNCTKCGKLKQRKSKQCALCLSISKQYPYSKKKHISTDGYVYVYYKNHPYADKAGRIYEHRLIMEKKIGRYLFPFENVHHKNGIRLDNRIENLELWTKVQPTGARVKDIVKWAREVLKLYGGISSVG
jgi:hypothetical protein